MRIHRAGRRLATVLALGALAAVTACAPSTESSSPEATNGSGSGSGQKTVTVWSWRTEDAAAYGKIFAAFEKSHPGIKVVFKPFKSTEYNTILATGVQGSGGPDVAQLRAYGGLQPLIEAGNLVPLDGKVDGLDGFDPNVLEGAKGKKDGKVYGVPFAVQTLQVFYNKKIFADNGITVPRTWAEMLSAADKLQKAGVTPFATTGKDSWMLPIDADIFGAARYGGKAFEDKVMHGQATFTDPDYVASLGLLQQVAKYFPKDVSGVAYTDAQTLFTSGKAAMYPGGSFEYGFFKSQNPDLQMGTFQVPPPPGSVSSTPVVPGYADGSFGVSEKAKDKAAALELVRWMATKEFGQGVADELKQISAVPGVTPSDPMVRDMAASYAKSPAPYLLLKDFRYGQPTGTDLLGADLQKMLLGQEKPADVAANLQKGISQWFKPTS